MRTLALIAMFTPLAVGCGASPEFAESPDDQAMAEAAEPAATTRPRSSPPQQQPWECAGSTAVTRQHGRLSRHQSIEGFTTRTCIQPSVNAELDPRR